MKGKAIIPLVLGLCVGLVAVKYLVNFVNKANAKPVQEKITVVRAVNDIDAFSEIKPEMLEAVETVENNLAPSGDRIESIEDVVGRVTSKAVPRGVPVLLSMLAPEGTPVGMPGRIPSGFRAVSVEIDEVTAVAYQIRPGDMIDVIVVMDIDSGSRKRKRETIAEVILQRVEVVAVGQAQQTGTEEGSTRKIKPAKSVTLLVPESDVPKVHLAQTRGKLTLSLRGSDDAIVETPATAHSDDLDPTVKPEPVQVAVATPPQPTPTKKIITLEPEPEPPHTIMVFRSTTANTQTQVDRVVFENAHSRTIVTGSQGQRRSAAAVMNNRKSAKPARQQPVKPADEVRHDNKQNENEDSEDQEQE